VTVLRIKQKGKMTQKQAIQLFEEKRVRTAWDTAAEKWWFSVVDVVSVLTDSDYQTARKYWKVLKGRLIKEGNETVTNCYQLKFQAPDGKMRLTDVADTEQLFRLIQSIPSPKAEPFKQWMAQVAAQRIDQMQDPELSIEQAVADYRRLGYSEAWINQRMRSIEVRKHLTDEWKRAGLEEGQQFASLTDIIYRGWSGLSAKEYKQLKGLKKENLRDNMTDLEIAINMLAEATTTQISKNESPKGMMESAKVARRGGATARVAREAAEKEIGQPVVSSMNAKQIAQNDTPLITDTPPDEER
jgi:prophage antirepressor-like protein